MILLWRKVKVLFSRKNVILRRILNTCKKTMDLPQDPMMLFSVINMKLRDFYPSLDALCEDLNVNKEELIRKLAAFGFEYSEENNKFW